MKMNKKGFTLIEMLVVIAIIAILVAIVIPVVGAATEKAQEATDASNIRAAVAEITIAKLTNEASTGVTLGKDSDNKVTASKDVALKDGKFDKLTELDSLGGLTSAEMDKFVGAGTYTIAIDGDGALSVTKK